MRRFRFNIGSLVVLVVLAGVGFAGLREANDLWDSGVFTLTLGFLLLAILFAIHRMESRLAFWIGFALFGWSYLGLASIPWVESRLLTTRVLAYLEFKVPGRPIITDPAANPFEVFYSMNLPDQTLIGSDGQGGIRRVQGGTVQHLGGPFMRIGHALLALIVAWLGGRISGLLFVRSRMPTSKATSTSASSSTGSGN